MRTKARALDGRDWLLLAEAGVAVLAAQAALALVPFRRVADGAGRLVERPGDAAADPGQRAAAEKIGWAVRAVARRTPWATKCLAQALAAKWLLNRRRLPGTLYLGVRGTQTAGKSLAAHAWVRSGGMTLTGESGAESFRVIGMFE